ncbi:MAG: hypothetical protein M1824_001641 [Vezdaea acicularis]|nr:MAG: hypothetical protein M1824_001641 [Vezdaea acicularis]
MASRRARVTVATSAALPNSHRLPISTPSVQKALSKLSRSALISLALNWLKESSQPLCAPFLADNLEDVEQDDDEALYPVASSIQELREIYNELRLRKGGKREIVDRVTEGDWRHGITLHQLAMVDIQYLLDHPTSQKWSAMKLVPATDNDSDGVRGLNAIEQSHFTTLPRFHGPTFLQNMSKELSSIVKAHFYLMRPKGLQLTLLRVRIYDSPYSTGKAASEATRLQEVSTDGSKTLYVAFPDDTPHIYVSLAAAPGLPAGGEGRSLRKLVLGALPKAFSRPQHRYTLQSALLTARTLGALLALRGPGRGNAAGGGWSIFAEGTVEESPLESTLTGLKTPPEDSDIDKLDEDKENHRRAKRKSDEGEEPLQKRRKIVAEGRFGVSGKANDGKGIERLDIRMEERFPDTTSNENDTSAVEGHYSVQTTKRKRGRPSIAKLYEESYSSNDDENDAEAWRPDIRLTFHGNHVFAGIRSLVEAGVIDGKRMPGWMTGEGGVSVAVVKNGRIRGYKGSGL